MVLGAALWISATQYHAYARQERASEIQKNKQVDRGKALAQAKLDFSDATQPPSQLDCHPDSLPNMPDALYAKRCHFEAAYLNEEIAYREWERQFPPGNPMMTSEQCEFERQENGMILLRCDLTHISLRP